VPIGDAPLTARYLARLQKYYREALRLETQVLPPFRPDLRAWNRTTRQWSAEALVDQLIAREETRHGDAIY
jgi:hypothetical protein